MAQQSWYLQGRYKIWICHYLSRSWKARIYDRQTGTMQHESDLCWDAGKAIQLAEEWLGVIKGNWTEVTKDEWEGDLK